MYVLTLVTLRVGVFVGRIIGVCVEVGAMVGEEVPDGWSVGEDMKAGERVIVGDKLGVIDTITGVNLNSFVTTCVLHADKNINIISAATPEMDLEKCFFIFR